jgi:hypothetical protein
VDVFSIALTFLWGVCLYNLSTGIGTWGLNKTVGLGMGYHKLRLVGWYLIMEH